MALAARFAAALLCSLVAATPALADRDKSEGRGHDRHERWDRGDRHDGRGHGHGHGHGPRWDRGPAPVIIYEAPRHHHRPPPPPVVVERRVVPVYPGLAPVQRRVIYEYFEVEPMVPRGLPPGIAKKIRKGHRLPPGIVYEPVPMTLVRQVPACMNGWECILAGADMLILDAVHGTVADIVRGVVR